MSLPETYKALRAHFKGSPPQLDELPLPKPSKNHLLVKMEFAPINPSDVSNIKGEYSDLCPFPVLVGLEGSGTVAALDEDLKVQHKIGDKVYVLGVEPDGMPGFGTIGQYVVVNSETCRPIKEGLSMEDAACHFINPGTVYYMGYLAQKKGHKAAIHTAGTSTLGRMFIKYFKHIGIKSINIVRRDEVIEELKKDGADYVLNSKDPDFETKLKEIAAKEKATIAFDGLSGEMTAKVIRNQPPGSVCHAYGKLSGEPIRDLDHLYLQQNRKLKGLRIMNFMNAKQGEITKILDEVHALLPDVFKTPIQKVFNLEDVHEALEYNKENRSKGKILLKCN